jgi:hypothetical protein
MWRHFASLHHDQDARGCRPHCLQALHGRDGLPAAADEAGPGASAPVAFLIADPVVAEENAAA